MSNGTHLALGGIAAIAAASLLPAISRLAGSAARIETQFDGLTLEVEEDLERHARETWDAYAYEGVPERSVDVPGRDQYRTLANYLERKVHRVQPRNAGEAATLARTRRGIQAMRDMADLSDSVRGHKPIPGARPFSIGDRVRVVGNVPFKADKARGTLGMEAGKIYEIHAMPTANRVEMIVFRLVDTLGRATKHETGAFRAASIRAHIPLDPLRPVPPGIGALVIERSAPADLDG